MRFKVYEENDSLLLSLIVTLTNFYAVLISESNVDKGKDKGKVVVS